MRCAPYDPEQPFNLIHAIISTFKAFWYDKYVIQDVIQHDLQYHYCALNSSDSD